MYYHEKNNKLFLYDIYFDEEKLNEVIDRIILNEGEKKIVIDTSTYPIEETLTIRNVKNLSSGLPDVPKPNLLQVSYEEYTIPHIVGIITDIKKGAYEKIAELDTYRAPHFLITVEDPVIREDLIDKACPFDKYIDDIYACIGTSYRGVLPYDSNIKLFLQALSQIDNDHLINGSQMILEELSNKNLSSGNQEVVKKMVKKDRQ